MSKNLWGGLKKRTEAFEPGCASTLHRPLDWYISQKADRQKLRALLQRYTNGEVAVHDELYTALLPFIRVFLPRYAQSEAFNLRELRQLLAIQALRLIEAPRCVGFDPEQLYRYFLVSLSRNSWHLWYAIRGYHARTGRADVRQLYSERYYDSYEAVDDALFFEQAASDLRERILSSSLFRSPAKELVAFVVDKLLDAEPVPRPPELAKAFGLPTVVMARELVSHATVRARIAARHLREEYPDISWERERRWDALFAFDVADWGWDPFEPSS